MKIKLNGYEEYFDKKISLQSFLKERIQDHKKIVVVHNDSVVKKNEWCEVLLEDNDTVEILKFVGGG